MSVPFPSGSVARLFRNEELPERLRAAHGALLAITGRPRLPSLQISQESHCIVKMAGPAQPAGGWNAVAVAAEGIERGGSAWLSFNDMPAAYSFIRATLPRCGIALLEQSNS